MKENLHLKLTLHTIMQSLARQKKKNSLSLLYAGDAFAFRYYLESIQLKIKGQWRDAGDRMVKCAELFLRLKMGLEAATALSEAAECYLKVDKGEALKSLGAAVKSYCDIGRFDIAGKIERKIAIMHYRIKHWDDAAFHYKRCANFLSGDRLIEQSDRCMERAAECLIRIGEIGEAQLIYEKLAVSCVNSNLRRFMSPKMILKAIFCLFAVAVEFDAPTQEEIDAEALMEAETEASSFRYVAIEKEPTITGTMLDKYEEVYMKNNEYELTDYVWKCCKEKRFVQNLIECRRKIKYHEFIDHLYHWNNVHPFDDVSLILLKVPVQELQKDAAIVEARKAAKIAAKNIVSKRKKNKQFGSVSQSTKSNDDTTVTSNPTTSISSV